MALEILEDLPNMDTVIVPWGGGTLLAGVTSTFQHLKPNVKVYASEAESATPLTEALEAGETVVCKNYKPAFIDGMQGSKCFLKCGIWESTRLQEGLLILCRKL